jgi:hypothetical protein
LSRRWSRGSEIGAEFARALAVKDPSRLIDLMHPEIDFRGLTPNRSWEANGPDAVLSVLLGRWFEDSDDIEALEGLESDPGQIEWMRVVRSGFRERDPQVP